MQKIKTIQKSKLIDYGSKKVNSFWLKINDKPNYEKENKNLEQISSVFNDIQDSVICIQTEELNHPEIIKAIFNASKRRNRIYILTNEKDTNLKQLEGACLVRYGIQNIGSFILINPNTTSNKGIIFTAPFIETSLANSKNIILELNKTQIKTLFRFFSDNFWNKAEFEIIEDYNNPIETSEPPLDFLPNIKDFCDANFVKNEISKINSDALISVSSLQANNLINFASLTNSKILTTITDNTEYLTQLTTSKNTIFANTTNILNLIITDNNNSWLIPKTNISDGYNFFALKLNSNQIKSLKNKLLKNIESSEFEFNLSKTRNELNHKFIRLLNNIDDEIVIKSENDIELGKLELTKLLPKEKFENQEPEFIDDNTSVKINYSWEIIPFYTPKNAKKAKLYSEWEKYQNEYNIFLRQIENKINESVSKKITEKLKRWFLGKKQTITKQQEELNSLKSNQLSILKISDRKIIIQKLNELAKDVSTNLSEIDTEIKKSKVEEEIERLKKSKKEKKFELDIFIDEQEEKLKEIEGNNEELLNKFLEKYEIKKDELAKYKSEWQRKKNKKKGKIAEDQEKLKELQEIEGFNFRKKIEEEKHSKKREITNIENKIKSKEKDLEKIEKEKNKNEGSSLNYALGKGNNKNKANITNEFNIPDTVMYLPKAGELFELGNQKYLEIEFWEGCDLGLKEAERLKAKLSAKQN